MGTKDSVTSAATATTTSGINPTFPEEEEEMPLLFMDQLPSNFAHNAQLAAIATFMATDDDDTDEVTFEAGFGSKERRRRHHKTNRVKRRQEPYTKPLTTQKEAKNQVETKSSDTKELQLFLSLFHVS